MSEVHITIVASIQESACSIELEIYNLKSYKNKDGYSSQSGDFYKNHKDSGGVGEGGTQNVTVSPLDIGNPIMVVDYIRTAIAVKVHNFRIGVFCYAKYSSSVEKTNRVRTAVCLFSQRFSLSLNFYYSYSAVYVLLQFYKTFSQPFLIFSSL